MATFKKNDIVRLKQPIIEGTVIERVIIEDEDCFRIQWETVDGELHERIFNEAELELV